MMAGTGARGTDPHGNEAPWPLWKLGAMLYPFTAAAVAINLFLLGLMWQVVGIPALSPMLSLVLAVPLGVPASLAAARWLRHLIDEAGG